MSKTRVPADPASGHLSSARTPEAAPALTAVTDARRAAEPPATAARGTRDDPQAPAIAAARELLSRLMGAMQSGRGVHAPSLLTALGALAGHACQMSVRAVCAAKGLPVSAALQVFETPSGQRFYFGDLLNQPLFEAEHSVWRLVGAQALALGAATLPDPHDFARHTARTVGTPAFGVPRDREAAYRPLELPIDYLRHAWSPLFAAVRPLCPDPTLWPLAYAHAAGQAMALTCADLPPLVAFHLVMEAAVPMAKVEPDGASLSALS